MSTLTITVNHAEHQIPDTVTSEADILRAIDFDSDRYNLYRAADTQTLDESDRVGEPAVVDAGDEFVAIPQHVTGG